MLQIHTLPVGLSGFTACLQDTGPYGCTAVKATEEMQFYLKGQITLCHVKPVEKFEEC